MYESLSYLPTVSLSTRMAGGNATRIADRNFSRCECIIAQQTILKKGEGGYKPVLALSVHPSQQ